MKMPPHVNILHSYRAGRMIYLHLVCEGIDNSFDANARMVQIDLGEQEVVFRDDGIGITRDRYTSIFRLGEHGEMNTTKLGRFGVGLKVQAINAGDYLEVISDSRDGHMVAHADWPEVEKTDWDFDEPVWSELKIVDKTGTKIRIAELRSKPELDKLDALIDGVAVRFYPALAEERRIAINGRKVPLLADPKMKDTIDCKLTFSNDRSARLHAGILLQPSKTNPLNRVHVGYGHRIIMPNSTLGCKEYGGGADKMFARLQLYGFWELSTYKNDLPNDAERAELDEAVFEKLCPLLEQCRTQHISQRIKDLTLAINKGLPENLRAVRPPRAVNPQRRKGPKRGKRGGKTDSEENKPGPARTAREPKLLITLEGNYEEHGIGWFDSTSRPYRVDLAKDHPQIKALIDNQDRELAENQLRMLGVTLYHEGRQWLKPQRELDEMPFGKKVADTLNLNDERQATQTGSGD